MTVTLYPQQHADDRLTSPNTRYEWQVTALHAGQTVADIRGICTRYTCAVRHVTAELTGVPAGTDAHGWVRGLTVTFTPATATDEVYTRWDRQAVAVRAADGEITWSRNRDPDGMHDVESAGKATSG